MKFNPILQRFVDRVWLPVMHTLLQRELNAGTQQYTSKLLFSTRFELMTQVVLHQSGSIRAAWLATDVGVSLAKLLTAKAACNHSTQRHGDSITAPITI